MFRRHLSSAVGSYHPDASDDEFGNMSWLISAAGGGHAQRRVVSILLERGKIVTDERERERETTLGGFVGVDVRLT
jgi:hypothetical protein